MGSAVAPRQIEHIAIIGGGPAGAFCGEQLARGGLHVTLFDQRGAWEKPCGGGLTYKAVEAYPFLLAVSHPKKEVSDVELIADDGPRARLRLDKPIVIYAREVLNRMLLERAVTAGCRLVQARVSQLEFNGRVRMLGPGVNEEADFVVIAAGARNFLVPNGERLSPHDLELTVGYFLPLEETLMRIKFVRNFAGYLWSFPRVDHLSVGICGKLLANTAEGLRAMLDRFLKTEGLDGKQGRFYSHILPSLAASTLRRRRLVGERWALIGDAAGWVDPVTGEGLYYALRSAHLLSESLLGRNVGDYPRRLLEDFGHDLIAGAEMAQRFFFGRFLGRAVTTRMIQFTQRSASFRKMMEDLFSGALGYRALKRRLWSSLLLNLAEMTTSFVASTARLGFR
jgi:flavin-dependent dehydrogenase